MSAYSANNSATSMQSRSLGLKRRSLTPSIDNHFISQTKMPSWVCVRVRSRRGVLVHLLSKLRTAFRDGGSICPLKLWILGHLLNDALVLPPVVVIPPLQTLSQLSNHLHTHTVMSN
eukprot:515639-Pelagomonas_calceolata.AAC.1